MSKDKYISTHILPLDLFQEMCFGSNNVEICICLKSYFYYFLFIAVKGPYFHRPLWNSLLCFLSDLSY